MKKSGKWVIDSDISVDYRNKTIEFSNEVRAFEKKQLLKSLVGYAIMSVVIFFVCFVASDYVLPIEALLWFLPAGIGMFFILMSVFNLFTASGNTKLRNFYFKFRKGVRKQVTILNPDTKVEYLTRNGMPLIDLEYDEDIRKKLTTVEMKKIVINKGKRFKRIGTLLTINLSGKTEGELVIKEY